MRFGMLIKIIRIFKLFLISLPDCDIPALLYRLHVTSLLWYINGVLYCLLHALIKTVKSINSCTKDCAYLRLSLHNIARFLCTDLSLDLGTGCYWQGQASSYWGLEGKVLVNCLAISQ